MSCKRSQHMYIFTLASIADPQSCPQELITGHHRRTIGGEGDTVQPSSTTRVLYLSQCAKTCLTYVQRFAPLTRFRLVSIPQHSRPLLRSTMDCLIPADPDIAGIGVRAATYAQNFLSFVPAVFALLDGKVELNELKMVEKQSTTILITAFAILISAVIQSLTFGLSSFHAAIILDLSWMNNTNTFIYFLLYIHHKSDPERGSDQILPKWADWYKHVWKILRLRTTSTSDHEAGTAGGPSHHTRLKHTLTSNERRQWLPRRTECSHGG
jgi:hypothetical protein